MTIYEDLPQYEDEAMTAWQAIATFGMLALILTATAWHSLLGVFKR